MICLDIITDPVLVKVAALDVHALHHSMELTPYISEFLPFLVGIAAVAQLFEVLASVRRLLFEQFNNHLLDGSIDVDI